MVVEALARDAPPPNWLASGLGEAERAIVGQFDLVPVLDHVRLLDVEYRQSDDLVLLYFEIRRYPYLSGAEVWLGSRCVPISDFIADGFPGMYGGYVHGSRALDEELVYVRGPDQSPC